MKGPRLLGEVGKGSSQTWVWMEDPNLAFFKKGFKDGYSWQRKQHVQRRGEGTVLAVGKTGSGSP